MVDEIRSPSGSADYISTHFGVQTASGQIHTVDEDQEDVPVVIPGYILRQARSESYENGWKDVYRRNHINPERLFEEEPENEEKEDFTESILEYQHDKAHEALRNRDWIGFHISRELTELYEETGVYWMLEGSDEGLEPVLRADRESLVIVPEYDPANAEYEEENDPEKDHIYHPIDTLESSNYIDNLATALMNYSVEEIGEPPAIDRRLASKWAEIPDSNDLYASDLAEGYRESVMEMLDES